MTSRACPSQATAGQQNQSTARERIVAKLFERRSNCSSRPRRNKIQYLPHSHDPDVMGSRPSSLVCFRWQILHISPRNHLAKKANFRGHRQSAALRNKTAVTSQPTSERPPTPLEPLSCSDESIGTSASRETNSVSHDPARTINSRASYRTSES